METAALYLRLSKEDKEESIENQRLLLQQYCRKNHYRIVKEYVDEDRSGLTDDRPAFRQMITDAQNHCFQAVIVKNQSRFSRNFLHVEKYLHRQFRLLGIRLVGVTDGVDTDKENNKKARQIYALINEWYCEDLSENVRLVLAEKIRTGQFIGSFAPYGYQKTEGHPIRLIPKYPQADIVKQIFSEYAGGKTVKQITEACRKKEYPAPGEKKPEKWCERAIYRILENEVYLGRLQQGKSYNMSYKCRKRILVPREDWVCKEHTHPALVSEELFQEVQLRKKKRGRRRKEP